jgi:hypothetical protein
MADVLLPKDNYFVSFVMSNVTAFDLRTSSVLRGHGRLKLYVAKIASGALLSKPAVVSLC